MDAFIGENMRIMSTLKVETVACHAKLEALTYFGELIAHRLPLECYVNQLKALSIIHSVLEELVASSTTEQVARVWEDDFRKLPLLMDDIRFFEPRVPSDNTPSIEVALQITKKIRQKSIEQPFSLLGYLYVMEGSTLGNHMHQQDVIKCYHLNGSDGSRYYASYGNKVISRWQQFTRRMNEVLDDPAMHGPVIETAHQMFAGLESLYTNLYPLKKSRDIFHVARINPEAGNHPIPTDRREIQAALNASSQCWNEYLYFEKRYGDRGKRFSDSDTCWLVTLTSLDQTDLQKQVDWLCRVLSTRGMPSIMMETILHFLSLELTAAIPENKALYHKLLKSSEKLKENRLKHIDEKVFRNLAEEFEQGVEIKMNKFFKNTGSLLVSAIIDEKNGIAGAQSGLKKWFIEVEGMGDAVEQTIFRVNSIIS
jgi:heme oxygenase